MKTHAYQRHEKRKSASDAKKSAERASRSIPSQADDDAPAMTADTDDGNGAQDNDAAAEAENQGDNEDSEDGEDTDQEGQG